MKRLPFRVCDRRGSEWRLEPGQIAGSLALAMTAEDLENPDLPRQLELASIRCVERSLNSPEELVDLDRLFEAILQGTKETGYPTIAERFLKRRNFIAERLSAPAGLTALVDNPQPYRVTSRAGEPPSGWEREQLVELLRREVRIERSEAEEIAVAVEARVDRLERESIPAALLRTLVAIELFERGFFTALEASSQLSISRFDLEEALFAGGGADHQVDSRDPERLRQSLGRILLRQYAYDSVYSSELRRDHERGVIDLHATDDPFAHLRIGFDASHLANSGEASVHSVFRDLSGRVLELSKWVSGELEIHHLAEAVARLPRTEFDFASRLARDWIESLRRLVAIESIRGRPLRLVQRIPFVARPGSVTAPESRYQQSELSLFGSNTGREEWALPLIEGFRQLLLSEEGRALATRLSYCFEVGPETFERRHFREALLNILLLLPRPTRVTFQLQGRVPAAGADVAGKVTANLPRLARSVRSSLPLEEAQTLWHSLRTELRRVVGRCLEAIRARAEFLERIKANPHGPLAGLSRLASAGAPGFHPNEPGSAPSYAFGLFGLNEAVQILWGKSLHESPEARNQGYELLKLCHELLAQERRDTDPAVWFEETSEREVIRRLEEIDRCDHDLDALPVKRTNPSFEYTPGCRPAFEAPIDPLSRWRLVEPYREWVRFDDQLEESTTLYPEGPEVLIAFLEEICDQLPYAVIRPAR